MRGVQHFGHGRIVENVQQRVQRRQGQRIDTGHLAGNGDLDQTEPGVEGLFADKFGIQRQPGCVAQASAEIGERRLIDDVKIAHSDRQGPDLPPIFSSRRTSVTVMPRSTALHMS